MRVISIGRIEKFNDGQVWMAKVNVVLVLRVIRDGDLIAFFLIELVFVGRPTEGFQSKSTNFGVRSDETERFKNFTNQQGLTFQRDKFSSSISIERAADEFDKIVVLSETTEGVVNVQRLAMCVQHHRLIKF